MVANTGLQGKTLRTIAMLLGAASVSLALVGCGGGVDESVSLASGAEPGVTTFGTVISANSYQGPSNIRTRYGFDGLPNTPAGQGSGQLIAVISSWNNPDLAENLNTFSAKYGLPQCTVVTNTYYTNSNGYLATNIAHSAPGGGCTIQVINTDGVGHLMAKPSNTLPSLSPWMMESSMDIEWAHAMAPMANILVVQSANNFLSAMGGAAAYASINAGADVVSMSWGIGEMGATQCTRKPGSNLQYDPTCSDVAVTAKYWNAFNYLFTGQYGGTATFVAASGDSGGVQWPSLSPNVLAVGGTVETGAVDIGWGGSGGGTSVSFSSPTWQAPISKTAMRAIPDVAYDAGTAIAVYVKPSANIPANTGWPDTTCVKANGAANCGWYGVGGTSAGAPQWAGIIAVTKAIRKENGKPAADMISKIYDVALVPGQYVTSFGDVVSGGTKYQTSKAGYDLVTGLGVPRTSVLVNYLVAN